MCDDLTRQCRKLVWFAGGAQAIADLMVSMGRAMGGSAAIQVSMYLATALLSNIVANNAAAALMFPIAINVANQEDLNKDRMAFLLMLAASASFAVPFGYQTNLMVFGAGGYSFNDFLKFGGPLQVSFPLARLLHRPVCTQHHAALLNDKSCMPVITT